MIKKGGESRLSLEGLHGVKVGKGKTITSIRAHGEARKQRTVYYSDGTKQNVEISYLLALLLMVKGYDDVTIEETADRLAGR